MDQQMKVGNSLKTYTVRGLNMNQDSHFFGGVGLWSSSQWNQT